MKQKKPPLCEVIGLFQYGFQSRIYLRDIGNHNEHLEIGEDPAAAVRDFGQGCGEVFYRDLRRFGSDGQLGAMTEITFGRREDPGPGERDAK